jgi:hypothetical protein
MSHGRPPGSDVHSGFRPGSRPDSRNSSWPDSLLGPGSTRARPRPYPGVPPAVVPRQWRSADRTAPSRRSGGPRWLIVLAGLIALLLVPGLLAVVALPVFLGQRTKAEYRATTVELPANVHGLKRNTGTKAKALARSLTGGEIGAGDVAVYGPAGRGAVIIVAVKPPAPMSEAQQAAERDDLERAWAARGTPLFLIREPNAGELGGWLGCGRTTEGRQVCLATSIGSVVTVISTAGRDRDPVRLLLRARAATVRLS